MNKKTLIDTLSTRMGKTKSETKEMVESIFGLITEEMAEGKAVRIVGFGEFEVRDRIAREGRNPKTGVKLHIPATKTPSFAPGKTLKDAVKKRK